MNETNELKNPASEPENDPSQAKTANAAGSGAEVSATGPSGDDGTAGGNGEGAGDGEAQAEEKTFSQAQVERIIAQRLAREREKQERQAAEAAEEQLRAKGEWEKLAESRQKKIGEQESRIAELEAQAGLVEKYEEALGRYRDQLVEQVPEHVRALLDGRDMADQLSWLTDNVGKFKPGEDGQAEGGQAGNGTRTIPSTPATREGESITAEQRRRMAYKARI